MISKSELMAPIPYIYFNCMFLIFYVLNTSGRALIVHIPVIDLTFIWDIKFVIVTVEINIYFYLYIALTLII